ncbi:MAG: hypothetical protein SOV48_02630 [Intestinibacter sp.]|nr:hypothetical protein [Intestinibacter sp.]
MTNLAKTYKKLPSEILRITDSYVAFCFDEACLYISNQLEKIDNEDDVNNLNWIENRVDEETGQRKTFVSEALKKKKKMEKSG